MRAFFIAAESVPVVGAAAEELPAAGPPSGPSTAAASAAQRWIVAVADWSQF